jgi:hypothetical protein
MAAAIWVQRSVLNLWMLRANRVAVVFTAAPRKLEPESLGRWGDHILRPLRCQSERAAAFLVDRPMRGYNSATLAIERKDVGQDGYT